MPRPPTLPQVALPVEDEFIPADETIEDTDLDLYEDIVRLDRYGQGRGAVAVRPRPIKDVIPEYPEKERKQGIKGEVVVKLLVNSSGSVDSVMVISNSTSSQNFIKAAKRAAYKTKYLPAKYK
ncbi:MAG: TonB family protein, partial [bacterium]